MKTWPIGLRPAVDRDTGVIRVGADDGTRTRNRRFTKPLLYQLSYVGAQNHTAGGPVAPGDDRAQRPNGSSGPVLYPGVPYPGVPCPGHHGARSEWCPLIDDLGSPARESCICYMDSTSWTGHPCPRTERLCAPDADKTGREHGRWAAHWCWRRPEYSAHA